jgi:SAM-dependent methyltransferase
MCGATKRHARGCPSGFSNAYEDAAYAEAYATLELVNTYYLAYRDLPRLILGHVQGRRAVDFGCGTGRSTRFLRQLGFDAVGIDISKSMIRKAHAKDPAGDYRLIQDGRLDDLEAGAYDLVLSVFTFDNIPSPEHKVALLNRLGRLLCSAGRIVSLVSAPEVYTHEWASFSTRDFPENHHARSGDTVRIIITDIADRRPVEDVLWSDESYMACYEMAGLELVETHRPLAHPDEPFEWISETRIPPWTIYVLKRATTLK